MSVSHDDDNFDFNKLEKELKVAVEADEKYTRENDAKLRAVQQKVGSYEEFREIVLASHLKPLEKGDKIDGKFAQPWNIHADKTKDQEKYEGAQINQNDSKIPKNGQEFVREWRKLTAEQKYNFLFAVGSERLENIFKPEISFGLLGEFLCTLQDFREEDSRPVLDILEALSKTNRFTLAVQFLSSKEKDACAKLFNKVDSTLKSSDWFKSLKKLYGLKE